MYIKKRYLFQSILILLFITQLSYGQVNLGFYSGYGISSFEAQDGNADMLPVGLQMYYSMDNLGFISLNFGVDFNYSAIPFSFILTNNTGQTLITKEQNQLHVGALLKVKFIKGFILNPYIRLGAGLYTGNQSLEYSDELVQEAQQQQIILPNEIELTSAFGFNFGAGLDLNLTTNESFGLFLEFTYHLNSREIDESPFNVFPGVNLGKQDLGFDNMAFLLGFQVKF